MTTARLRPLKDWFLRTDDGQMMRWAFVGLAVTAAVFVAIDLNEITAARKDAADRLPLETGTDPVLPPALTDGEPVSPPSEITTEREALRSPMRFDLQPGGILLARGTIDVGAAARFEEEIGKRGEYVKVVLLDSPGGSVEDALAMSRLVREKELTTRVAAGALCASSCPLVLAGGIVREAEEKSVVGVHQVFTGGSEQPSAAEAMSSAQATTARVSRHLDEMGIASGLWFHALETPPDRLYYLTPEEMRTFKLTTGDPAIASG